VQGNRKSSSCEALAGGREFYSNSLPDLQYQYKDAILHTRGKWIIEISELSSFTKAEVEKVKSFLSAGESDVRPPYGHFEENVKYQCVFIGPTNSGSYLKDATGNRRFIPAKTGVIDLDGLYRTETNYGPRLW
jgi:predicted P-loop ATPase